MKGASIVILFISVIIGIFTACDHSGNNRDNPEPVIDENLLTENYPGFVFNEATNQPVSDLKIQFTQFLGDSYIHGMDSARTDANGFFNIAYQYDRDSLLSVANSTGLDTSDIFHRIELITQDYLLITTLQNGEPLPVFKPKLKPDEVIDINVYSAGLLQIEMVDTTNVDLFDQVDVHFSLLDPFSILFDLNITNTNEDLKRWDILLPADLDILMETTIKEGIDTTGLTVVGVNTDTLSVGFQDTLSYVITH